MGDKTGIEWTDATWNPFVGCAKVSAGCKFCYAEKLVNGRMRGTFGTLDVKPRDRWTLPIRWQRPRRIFVTSLSDPFWDQVSDALIARMFAVMALAGRHTFQVLTKRPERMRDVVRSLGRSIEPLEAAARELGYALTFQGKGLVPWPLPNVWLGVSAENQETAATRIPFLLETPAAVRWVSAEPLLGPLNLAPWLLETGIPGKCFDIDGERWHLAGGCPNCRPRLDWVVAGGESGAVARPMDRAWAVALRDQCEAYRVAFLFKQWGNHAPVLGYFRPGEWAMVRTGKKEAGRELDGRTWDGYPIGRSER